MRHTLILCAVLGLVGPALADPPTIKLPAEIHGEAGAFITVRADTAGKIVKWYTPDKSLSLFPSDLLTDKRVAVVVAARPGTYRLIAWTAAGDEPSDLACTKIVIEGAAPPTPPPVPPVPPTPPPPPVDPLAADLTRLFQADTHPDKAKHLASMVELYRQASRLTDDASLETVGDLLRVVRAAAATLLPGDALPAVRKRLAEYLNTALELDAAAKLTPDRRTFAHNLFTRVSVLLGGIK